MCRRSSSRCSNSRSGNGDSRSTGSSSSKAKSFYGSAYAQLHCMMRVVPPVRPVPVLYCTVLAVSFVACHTDMICSWLAGCLLLV
jgi:hypothetical protein